MLVEAIYHHIDCRSGFSCQFLLFARGRSRTCAVTVCSFPCPLSPRRRLRYAPRAAAAERPTDATYRARRRLLLTGLRAAGERQRRSILSVRAAPARASENGEWTSSTGHSW